MFSNSSAGPLVVSERKLVMDLHDFWRDNRQAASYRDIEVCLLRNLPKVGIGLFVRSGFYPDFLLWIRDRRSRGLRVVFLDPHGLHHEGVVDNDRFEAIKQLRAFGREKRFKAKDIALDGYVLVPTSTPIDKIPGAKGKTRVQLEEEFPLLFQDGDYIAKVLRTPDQIPDRRTASTRAEE